jgi:hypothetical protein
MMGDYTLGQEICPENTIPKTHNQLNTQVRKA